MIDQSEHYPQQFSISGADNTGARREPTILCRSQSCLRNVEEQCEKGTKTFNNLTLIGMAIITAPIWIPWLKALFDEFNRDPEMPSGGVMFLLCVLALVIYGLGRKTTSYIRNNIEVYRNHCANEVLIVDEEKVYGGNSRGKVSIPMEEIASARYRAKTGPIPGEERLHLSNAIFEIRDRSGKEYTFYTFTNCSELHSVIDMQLRRLAK